MQKMLLAGQGVLCLVDFSDAGIRSGGPFANPLLFFSRLNFAAWSRFAYLGLKVSYRCLSNDTLLERYRSRAQAFGEQAEEVRKIRRKFSQTVDPMVEQFFKERHTQLVSLFEKLQADEYAGNYLAANEEVVQIGEIYGFKRKMFSFQDFDAMIESDEY